LGRRRIRRCNWPKNLKQSVDHRCRRSRWQKDRAHPHDPYRGRKTLHRFIQDNIELGSTVCTDGLNSYRELNGYIHNRKVQNLRQGGEPLLPRVHLVISLLKRWLLGTLQGSASDKYLDDYLNEFVFRFNRRRSASRGKLFYRLAQQAVNAEPATYSMLTSRRIPGGVKFIPRRMIEIKDVHTKTSRAASATGCSVCCCKMSPFSLGE
jgi:hypothetical protein